MQSAECGTETIVAVSTAAGASSRAIVRLSGAGALGILRSLAGPCEGSFSPSQGSVPAPRATDPLPVGTYRAFDATLILIRCVAVKSEISNHRSVIANRSSALRLPSRIYVMRAPASYTREDVVEIHTFGNPALLRALMEELIARGARPAGPGEFTRRAFLNGRLDLAQAEAVEALIRARDENECRAALGALGGGLARALETAREELTALAALIELSLDFSDQDVEVLSVEQGVERLKPVRRALAELAQRPDAGRVARAGVRVLLFGPPNAGKSSLFNRILNQGRAIVSPHPGTTRDTIEAAASIGGLDLLLVDTAGLRSPGDDVEALAVGRSRESLRCADIPLCVLDASTPPSAEARDALASADPARSIILLNKSDLGPCRPEWSAVLPKQTQAICLSAVTGAGIAELLSAIRERVESGRVDRAAGGLMVSARQSELLQRAGVALDSAADCAGEQTMELFAADVREALEALAECTGGAVAENVLDRIFSSFCIGK